MGSRDSLAAQPVLRSIPAARLIRQRHCPRARLRHDPKSPRSLRLRALEKQRRGHLSFESFYGGFADLLVTAVLGNWNQADTIDVMIGLDSWHPTRGTRITGERNTSQRMVVAGSMLVPLSMPRSEKEWTFDGALGRQAMVEVPFSEIVFIARHVKTAELHTWLNRVALDDIHSSTTPTPKAADDTGLSSQRFIVDVVATRDGSTRRILAHGRDIYAFSAVLACEGVERLLKGKFSGPGAQPPGIVFAAHDLLSALVPDPLTFEIRQTGIFIPFTNHR